MLHTVCTFRAISRISTLTSYFTNLVPEGHLPENIGCQGMGSYWILVDPSIKNIKIRFKIRLRSFDVGEELEFDLERRDLGEFYGETKVQWKARNITGPDGRYIKGVPGYKIRPEMIDEYYSQ